MTTRSDPQLQDTYNITLIMVFHISRKSSEWKSCTEGLQNIIDFLYFLLIHYSYSYHINVCISHIIQIDNIQVFACIDQ